MSLVKGIGLITIGTCLLVLPGPGIPLIALGVKEIKGSKSQQDFQDPCYPGCWCEYCLEEEGYK